MEMVAQAENLFGTRRTRRSAMWTRPATGLPAALKDSGRWRSRGALGNSLTGMAAVALATGDAGQAERLLDEATSVLRHAGPWFLSLDAVSSRHPGGAAREPR